MKKFIPDANIEDLDIKYTATAFDLFNNKEVVFKKGSLYDAIRASISIPTVFTPVVSGDSILVDGGVVNNVPIKNAIRTHNDTLIAVYVNSSIPPTRHYQPVSEIRKRKNIYENKMSEFKKSLLKFNSREQKSGINYFNLINSTIAAGTNCLASMIIQNHPPDILIEVSKKSCGTFDFFKAEELVEIGRVASRQKFDALIIDHN
jgi:NTE family protein